MSRNYCEQCKRPIDVCFCDSLITIKNKIPIHIIQHPSEQHHPFNTGRIAQLCLENCRITVAEKLNDHVRRVLNNSNTLLLYPELDWLPKAFNDNASGDGLHLDPATKHLIVIDATWRKSKKILHLNPFLQHLPRLSLRPAYESQYQIRHSSFKDSLSTIESIALALEQLEPETNYKALLKPFQRMIELQTQFSNPKNRERKKNIN
ncbi:DTW domain-containing protein [Aliikangiella marina]|uniref:tRNA-uridine aminocarboxypropyltransferase n=1 Tax=Aliikangiella marina TaxID=1712262 RepID=A0A545TJB6_9GAMM|nr:tRNA-uridine aminocarboxypropyltransferase [Aliikangiella marina]TQV77261.1 DTW domain-containing protein [Aliikangiella marina]